MGCIFSGAYEEIKNPEDIEEMDLCSQLHHISQDSSLIQYIDDPSLILQMRAVESDIRAIQHIKNPYDDVIKYVFVNDPHPTISPVEYMDYFKIERFYKRPGSKTLDSYVWYCKRYVIISILSELNSPLLRQIQKHLTDTEKRQVFDQNPESISNFDEISGCLQNTMIARDKKYIKFINNPGIQVDEVVMEDPNLIGLHKSPSEFLQLRAIQFNPELLQEIKNPTEKVMKSTRKLE